MAQRSEKSCNKYNAQQIDNDFEIIVVDSGSNDDTIKKLSQYACKIVYNTTR